MQQPQIRHQHYPRVWVQARVSGSGRGWPVPSRNAARAAGYWETGKELRTLAQIATSGLATAVVSAFLDRPPPGSIDAEEWRRGAIKTAFPEVQPESTRWFKEVGQMNPEAMENFNAVAQEAPPPGMDELEWV